MKFAHNNLAHVVALVGSLAATVPAAAAAAAGANSNVSRDLCKSAKERHLQITTEAPLVQPSPTVMTPAPTVPPTSVVFAGVQKYVGAAGADRGVEGEVKASLEEDDQVTGE